MLPKANSVDRVNPRPYHPLGVPEILLLSWLVDFLSSSGFSVVCLTWTAFSLFSPCCLLPWASGFEVGRPMASTPSPHLQPPAMFHTPPTLWPGGGERWLNHLIAGQHPAWISLMDDGIDSLADPCSTGWHFPIFHRPTLDVHQRDCRVTKQLIKAIKRQKPSCPFPPWEPDTPCREPACFLFLWKGSSRGYWKASQQTLGSERGHS